MSLCTASPKLPLDSPLHEREEYQYSFSLRNPIPSHIAQAAFALFLHRTTGQDDIAFTKANQLVCSTLDETISLDAFSCSLKIAEGQNQIEFSDTTPPTAEFGLHLEEGLIHLYDYPKKHHPDTLHRWAQHIENIAQGMIQSPSSKAKTFSYITQEEENLVCDQWNQTKKEYPLDRLLYQRIEDQVLLTPNAEAVRFLERSMSYTELNAKANRLAHFLRQQGVKKETLVAVCMERSIELVIALLGILKAGGAYVPMDPSYPKERLKSILSDSKSPFLITQASLQTHFRHDLSMQICLDDLHFLDAFSSTNPESINTQKDLCYVIYTSGSTGKPKGVGNVYEGVVNRILWMQDTYRLLSSDRVVQKTPFGFDVSVWEFFWPLMFGATLIMAKPGIHKDAEALAQLIEDEKITTIHFVPSMLDLFLEVCCEGKCPSLKRVFTSGEALPKSLERRFFQQLNTSLYNLYGPTEAAIDVTYWNCDPNDPRESVPIGYPIANIRDVRVFLTENCT